MNSKICIEIYKSYKNSVARMILNENEYFH